MHLTFERLRAANIARLPQFKNKHGEPAHSEPDGSDWSDAEWMQAVVGELGEYANVRKKLQRGDYTRAEALPMLADELADIATYLDIFAFRVGVDLGTLLRINHTPNWGSYLVRSDAEWLLSINSHVSIVSDVLLTGHAHQTGFTIMLAIQNLNALANQLGFDLCDAIVSKFNRVSDRVGCDVKL